MIDIAANVQRVQQQIVQACARVGRSPESVTLVAISKTQPPPAILAAVAAGLRHFGENRVEEAQAKAPAVTADSPVALTWHMVGHVQSRKAKEVVSLFQWVHSVDSVRLAGKLSALTAARDLPLNVLLEVNVSGEASKYGLAAFGWETDREVRRHLWDEIAQILALPGLRVRGLMTMAPIVSDPEQARPVFASLARLRAAVVETQGVALPDLSMGMTDDYPVAVEEGATLVRIGRAIFGEREK